ncbi:hypothetical protein HYH03_004372 [Edaphochlamys debaryana]|uniref:phytol kinase n=1 Tax=Edaphochlamys debaryana TaxID=47281 RepID=A0A835Y9W0_9CHLO|nr:hypothetical protein HYH03_004372 [Edaphochlamys debaryana]|eukprot:KAG2497632.1 hypothetical protein HYH03_004372 [Edaphochlamys debaryana]
MTYAGGICTMPRMPPPHRLATACSLAALVFSGVELLLGALLALVRGNGTAPLLLDSFDTDHIVASCCTSLHKALPGRLWGARGADWQPGALRALASKLAGMETLLGAELDAVAAKLEGAGGSSPEALQDSGAAAAVMVLAGRLAALKAEVRALLPACANPACVNLAGDSEAGLQLQPCAGCKAVGYCCRECQAAHAAAGQTAECGGKGK